MLMLTRRLYASSPCVPERCEGVGEWSKDQGTKPVPLTGMKETSVPTGWLQIIRVIVLCTIEQPSERDRQEKILFLAAGGIPALINIY